MPTSARRTQTLRACHGLILTSSEGGKRRLFTRVFITQKTLRFVSLNASLSILTFRLLFNFILKVKIDTVRSQGDLLGVQLH